MTNRSVRDLWSSAWAFTLSALFIGFAIQLNFGRLSTGAMMLLTLGLATAMLGVVRPSWRAIGERNVVFAIGAALAVEVGLLLVWPPGAAAALQDSGTLVPFRLSVALSGGAAVIAIIFSRRSAWALTAVFVIYLLAGAWVILLSPSPPNDVWHVQQVAGRVLLSGHNPYAVTMPNIYGPGSGLYAPSLEQGNVLDFGFPYPPLSLLMALPGIVLGDVRWALLAASAGTALLIIRCRPGRVATGAGLLLLFTPRTFFIIEQAWTEPLVALLLALTVFLACRARRLTPVALGLLAAAKQDSLLTLVLAPLLKRRGLPWRTFAAPAGVAGTVFIAFTVPLAVWDIGAFWHSVVVVQFLQPARPDALAYPAWLLPRLPQVASFGGFLALIPAGALVLWRSPRTTSGFAGAVAFTYLVFFAFSKQAFANYYYLVIVALCAAVASTAAPVDSPEVPVDSPIAPH